MRRTATVNEYRIPSLRFPTSVRTRRLLAATSVSCRACSRQTRPPRRPADAAAGHAPHNRPVSWRDSSRPWRWSLSGRLPSRATAGSRAPRHGGAFDRKSRHPRPAAPAAAARPCGNSSRRPGGTSGLMRATRCNRTAASAPKDETIKIRPGNSVRMTARNGSHL